jgi:hypothetical protein
MLFKVCLKKMAFGTAHAKTFKKNSAGKYKWKKFFV